MYVLVPQGEPPVRGVSTESIPASQFRPSMARLWVSSPSVTRCRAPRRPKELQNCSLQPASPDFMLQKRRRDWPAMLWALSPYRLHPPLSPPPPAACREWMRFGKHSISRTDDTYIRNAGKPLDSLIRKTSREEEKRLRPGDLPSSSRCCPPFSSLGTQARHSRV